MRNREYFKPWSPAYEENYFSIMYHKAWLESIERETLEGRIIKFGVYLKNDQVRIIGTVSFSNILLGVFQSCFMGYRFDEKETKKGYATEAVIKATDYMFNVVKLHRIEANIMPANTASVGVAERAGFTNEGLARKYLKVNGKWEDHYHFVLLNKDT